MMATCVVKGTIQRLCDVGEAVDVLAKEGATSDKLSQVKPLDLSVTINSIKAVCTRG